jgi:hypothetical protein
MYVSLFIQEIRNLTRSTVCVDIILSLGLIVVFPIISSTILIQLAE